MFSLFAYFCHLGVLHVLVDCKSTLYTKDTFIIPIYVKNILLILSFVYCFCIFSVSEFYSFVYWSVNFFMRNLVFRVTIESQHIHLHFIFPYQNTLQLQLSFSSKLCCLLLCRGSRVKALDFGSQNRGNLTINSNTSHFYFQGTVQSLISASSLAPWVIMPAIHSPYRTPRHRSGKAVAFRLAGVILSGQDLNLGFCLLCT